MFVTANQIVCHLLGDFFLQSDWQAQNKQKKFWIALVHAILYSLPFLFLTRSPVALAAICLSHCLIDHYRVAVYIGWVKNFLAPKWVTLYRQTWECLTCKDQMAVMSSKITDIPSCPKCKDTNVQQISSDLFQARNYPFEECKATGYSPERPLWMSVWLMILTDNTLHIVLNAAALKFLVF